MSVERIMREEAQKQYEEIGKMALGTEDYSRAVKGANEMMDRVYESRKITNEERRIEVEEIRADIERERIEADRRDRRNQIIINSLMFIISTGVTIWANIDSKNFERTDVHTTEAGKASTRKLLSFMDRFTKG